MFCQSERHVPERKAVGEVGGTVQGIYVPAKLGIHFGATALLGDDAVFREALAKTLHDQLLAGAVGGSDEVVIALQLEADAAMSKQNLACFARDFDRRVQIIIHTISV